VTFDKLPETIRKSLGRKGSGVLTLMGAINTIRCHIDTKLFGLTALNNDNNRGGIKYDAEYVYLDE
jgi:hypothetical protein